MSNLDVQPEVPVTALFEAALRGHREAQDALFRVIESRARRIARHWLRVYSSKGRVETTALIDDAFVKLVPPRRSPAGGAVPVPWDHRGAFYAYLCRVMGQLIVDMLRQQRRFAESQTVRRILIDAFNTEDIVRKLSATGGDPGLVLRSLRDAIYEEHTLRDIRAVGKEGYDVFNAFRRAFRPNAVRDQLLAAGKKGGDALLEVIFELFKSRQVRRAMTVYRSMSAFERLSNDRDTTDGPDQIDQRQPRLSVHTLLSLPEALEALDAEFGGDGDGRAPPTDHTLLPRQSLHAQVLDLLLIGRYSVHQVAELLRLTEDKVRRTRRIAMGYLREKFPSSFLKVRGAQDPDGAV